MSQTSVPELPSRVPPHQPCWKCGNVMRLSVIEPDAAGRDIHVLECSRCGHQQNVIHPGIQRSLGRTPSGGHRRPLAEDNADAGAQRNRSSKSLEYGIAPDGSGWRWELVTAEGRVRIQSGIEPSEFAARVAALRAAMEL
jgi:hypothetical protein